MNRAFMSLGVVILLAALAAAAALALLPLPTLNELDSPTGWCGPGYTSNNALQVKLNPDVVNGGTASPAQLQEFRDFCTGEANGRLMDAGVALVAGFVLGGGCAVAAWRRVGV